MGRRTAPKLTQILAHPRSLLALQLLTGTSGLWIPMPKAQVATTHVERVLGFEPACRRYGNPARRHRDGEALNPPGPQARWADPSPLGRHALVGSAVPRTSSSTRISTYGPTSRIALSPRGVERHSRERCCISFRATGGSWSPGHNRGHGCASLGGCWQAGDRLKSLAPLRGECGRVRAALSQSRRATGLRHTPRSTFARPQR
jgi:hypothetical protein